MPAPVPLNLDVAGTTATLTGPGGSVALTLPDPAVETHMSLLLLGAGGGSGAPTLVSAVVPADGMTCTITFSRAVTGRQGFAVTPKGFMTGAFYVSGEGTNQYVYTIPAAPLNAGVSAYLSYVLDRSGNGVPDGDIVAAVGGLAMADQGISVTNNSTVPPPPPPPSFTPIKLDFGPGAAPTQSGYTGFPWAAYNASPGYGYTSASPAYPDLDRAAAIYMANPDFFRDGHCNTYENGAQAFKFTGLTAGTSYDLRGYFYDAAGACNGAYFFRDKNATGNTTAPNVTAPSGGTAGLGVLTIAANGSGEIEVEWNTTQGGGTFAFCNGLEIALTGELPAALT